MLRSRMRCGAPGGGCEGQGARAALRGHGNCAIRDLRSLRTGNFRCKAKKLESIRTFFCSLFLTPVAGRLPRSPDPSDRSLGGPLHPRLCLFAQVPQTLDKMALTQREADVQVRAGASHHGPEMNELFLVEDGLPRRLLIFFDENQALPAPRRSLELLQKRAKGVRD